MGNDRIGAGTSLAPRASQTVRQPVPPLPLVSVIVPAYNAERFLRRALQSALAQTYSHLEIIVIDDGSTDGTAQIIRSFTDPRVRALSQPNRGQGAARNLGIRASAGRYLTFLDADDMYLPQKVQRQVEYLTAHPECPIVFCDALHFYARHPRRLLMRKSHPHAVDMLGELIRASVVNPNTMMISAETMRGGVWFREDRYYPEEWDLCLRLARAGHRFGYQPDGLVLVEIREDSNTAMTVQFRLKRYTLEMFEQLFAGMPERERIAYRAEAVLRACRQKLAWASLVSDDPVRAFERASHALPWPLALVLRALVRIVPSNQVRAAVAAAWKLRQRLGFVRVPPNAADQAWGSVRESYLEGSAPAVRRG